MCVCIYVCVYIYICIYICIFIYITGGPRVTPSSSPSPPTH